MPPRKRVKVSPTPTSQPSPIGPSPSKVEEEDLLDDSWTDEEEVGLFKGLIRYKPTGIHKHFRLLALHEYLLSNGYIQPRNEHTKLPGIWKKLGTLYDLEALDQREDARQLSDLSADGTEDDEAEDDDDDVYSLAANKIHKEDFQLPDDEFGELKWQQRFATNDERKKRHESPLLLPEVNLAEIPPMRFTPSFSIEPSDAPSPSSLTGRKKPATRGRKKNDALPGRTRRSARQAESVVEDDDEEGEADEQDGEEDDDEEVDDEEGSDDEGEEESESEEEKEAVSRKGSTPARSTRAGRGGGRPRGRPPRGRGAGRRRGKY